MTHARSLTRSLARSLAPKPGWPAVQALGTPPVGQFAAVAAALAVGVVLLARVAFGATPGVTLATLLLFAASASVAGRAFSRHYPHPRMGLCNAITLMRLAMAVALLAPVAAGAMPSWATFAVAVTALSLDGIDGWLARRQGYVSNFGARFDMEVDSVLALVLALSAAVSTGLGPWALVLGLPRYAFVAATWALPWMRRDLPDRFSRKAVCVVQLSALIALQAPILPLGLAVAVGVLAALALAWSFAIDVTWLRDRRV